MIVIKVSITNDADKNSNTSSRAATGGKLVSSYFYQIFSQTSFGPRLTLHHGVIEFLSE